MARATPQQRVRILGGLFPDGLLTKEGCMRWAGLGRRALERARQSGVVKPIYCNDRCYYRTNELIEWIESHSLTRDGATQ